MASTISLLVGAFVAWALYKIAAGYRKNIALAKRSGLPYYIVRKSRYLLDEI